MIIYLEDGTPLLMVEVDDTSYAYRSIMTSDEVRLEFALTEHIEMPVGCYILFQGVKYDLLRESNVRIVHNRDYEYVVTFQGPMERAKNYIVHNMVDKRLNFQLIAFPSEHLSMIVGNLNERDGAGTWVVGDCVNGEEVALGYNHTYCLDALSQLASACNTEWEITRPSASTFVVNLHRVEYNRSTPIQLGYGRNQGFVPGVERTGSTGAIEKVWIQGGERNISLDKYGASVLHLPQNRTVSFDGVHEKFSGEVGYSASSAVSMVTDADGYSVRLANAPVNATEGSLDLTTIYPKRVGVVSGVRFEYQGWYYTYSELIAAFPALTDEDWDSIQVDIFDSTIPSNLDYSQCLLDTGQPFIVAFQTGSMTGREFDAAFAKDSETKTRTVDGVVQTVTKPANRFELVKANIDGVNMPKRNFLPSNGDNYIIYNCYMPDAYIRNDSTHSGAEWDALRAACSYLYENKDFKRTYKGSIDGLFAKRNWSTLGTRLIPGSYISFSHPQVQPQPIETRIIGIRQYINDPESPEIEISNETISVGVASRIDTLHNNEASLEYGIKTATRYARRGFREAKETAQMLVAAALTNFSGAISPIVVQTMQALVGDESLQYFFVRSLTNMEVVDCPLSYDPVTKKLTSPSTSYIRHYTLGRENNIAPASGDYNDYMRWAIYPYDSGTLADAEKKYYVYVKVSKTDNTSSPYYQKGEFLLSETAIKMNSDPDYWHLLLGILNSENEGDRSFVTMYGFTEILPGRITTEKIVSSSGQSYWDMVNEAFRLGDRLSYDPTNGLILNNTFVQTGGGAVRLGAYCGTYQNDRYYSYGDQVSWTDNGVTMTYTYINPTRDMGHAPSYTSYWQISAQGRNGTNGNNGKGVDSITTSYQWSSDGTNHPTGGTWTSTPDTSHTVAAIYLWTKYTYTYTDNTTEDVYSVAREGQNGSPGTSANMPYKDIFDYEELYHGNPQQTDWVYHLGTKRYYIARTDAPNGTNGFNHVEPGVTQGWESYWDTFGANFDTIATDTILAVRGVFENAQIRVLKTAGDSSSRIVASGNTLEMYSGADNQRLVVHGNDMQDVSSNPPSGRINTGTVEQRQLTAEEINNGSTFQTYSDVIYINDYEVESPSNVLRIPDVYVRIRCNQFTGGAANITVRGRFTLNGVAISNGFTLTVPDDGREYGVWMSGVNIALSMGTAYYVALSFDCDCYGYETTGNAIFSINNDAANWDMVYTTQKTEIAANGFRVMFTSDDILQAVKRNNNIEFLIQAQNYGMKVDASGIYLRVGTSTYRQVILGTDNQTLKLQ